MFEKKEKSAENKATAVNLKDIPSLRDLLKKNSIIVPDRSIFGTQMPIGKIVGQEIIVYDFKFLESKQGMANVDGEYLLFGFYLLNDRKKEQRFCRTASVKVFEKFKMLKENNIPLPFKTKVVKISGNAMDLDLTE